MNILYCPVLYMDCLKFLLEVSTHSANSYWVPTISRSSIRYQGCREASQNDNIHRKHWKKVGGGVWGGHRSSNEYNTVLPWRNMHKVKQERRETPSAGSPGGWRRLGSTLRTFLSRNKPWDQIKQGQRSSLCEGKTLQSSMVCRREPR